MAIDKVVKYDNNNQTLDLIVRNQIISIKIPPVKARTFIARWYSAKAKGYTYLGDNLIRYEYYISEIEHPTLDEKFKVIKQKNER